MCAAILDSPLFLRGAVKSDLRNVSRPNATHCRPECYLQYNVILETSFWPNYLDLSTHIVDNIIYTTCLDQIVTHHPTPTAAE